MACQFSTSNELSFTGANFNPITSGVSIGAWLYRSTESTAWRTIAGVEKDSGQYFLIYARVNSSNFALWMDAGSDVNSVEIAGVSSQWVWLCGRWPGGAAGDAWCGYSSGASTSWTASNTSYDDFSQSFTSVRFVAGESTFGGENLDDDIICGLKIWAAGLTNDELLREKWTYMPKRIKDLKACVPFVGAAPLRDIRNGANWTEDSGSLSHTAGPPFVSWGSPVLIPQPAAAAATAMPGASTTYRRRRVG